MSANGATTAESLGLVALAVGPSAVGAVALPVLPLILAAVGGEILYKVVRQQ
jgi:hypothetical protein